MLDVKGLYERAVHNCNKVFSKAAVFRSVLLIRPLGKKGSYAVMFLVRKSSWKSPRQERRLSCLGSCCEPSPPQVDILHQLGAIRLP